ncbi:MAG: dTDP-4-dehydrorhamnose 3,5-epimerase family protein [Methanomicrobiales archaeon]
MELNYAVVSGNIKLVLYDARADSSTKRDLQEICMGEDNYVLVTVPPHIVKGFQAISNGKAIVVNSVSIAHDPSEISRLDPFDPTIGYDWGIRQGQSKKKRVFITGTTGLGGHRLFEYLKSFSDWEIIGTS